MTAKKIISKESHETVKPKDLIWFSDEYKKHRKDLISFFKNKKGEIVSFFIAHIESGGNWGLKKIEGFLKEVDDQDMVVETKNDYYCDYLTPVDLRISFYSLFDRIPLLNENINPFGYAEDKNRNHFFKLEEMKNLLRKKVGEKYFVKLFFAWDEFHPKFDNGNFFIEGVIKSVNDFGVEISSNKSCFYKEGQLVVANNISGNYFWHFISSESYLKRVIVYEECSEEDFFD